MPKSPKWPVLVLNLSERKLIYDIATMPAQVCRRIKEAGPGKARITLTPEELEELEGHISAAANHATSRTKQKILDAVLVKVKVLLGQEWDDQPSITSQEEPIVINLPDYSKGPLKLQDKAVDYLNLFAAELEHAGLDIEELLEQMQPTHIGPDDKISISLTAAERDMVLGLGDLAHSVKEQIKQTQTGKRKHEFTLRQINEIENAISQTMVTIVDKKILRKWETFDGKFIAVQSRYTTGDEPQNALGRMLSGEPVSRGAAVRDLLMQVLAKTKANRS